MGCRQVSPSKPRQVSPSRHSQIPEIRPSGHGSIISHGYVRCRSKSNRLYLLHSCPFWPVINAVEILLKKMPVFFNKKIHSNIPLTKSMGPCERACSVSVSPPIPCRPSSQTCPGRSTGPGNRGPSRSSRRTGWLRYLVREDSPGKSPWDPPSPRPSSPPLAFCTSFSKGRTALLRPPSDLQHEDGRRNR